MITYSNLGKYGRLGNQLFQIASTIGIAKKNNLDYGFFDWEYNEFLKNKLPNFQGEIQKKVVYDNFSFHDIILDENTDLFGYLQSYKFFNNVEINEIFELKNIYTEILNKYDFENSVSIHVRRTDYLSNFHIYEKLTLIYYKKALDYLNSLNMKISKIYIFSDDIEWCKVNFNFLENKIFVQDNIDIIDLFLMSRCENNIICNSTFSWWAAFLNKNKSKKIICPKLWYVKNNEIKNFVYDDLIPMDWIKI
jgi:hypothetical protein